MENEHRRRDLTPISGELRADVSWTPVETVEKRKPKPKALPPTTTRGMLLHGLKRLALIVGGISSGLIVVSLLIVYFGDADAASTFPVVFYVAGAAVAGGGLWSVFGQEWAPITGYEQVEKESWVSDVFTYFGLGATIIAIGVALEFAL